MKYTLYEYRMFRYIVIGQNLKILLTFQQIAIDLHVCNVQRDLFALDGWHFVIPALFSTPFLPGYNKIVYTFLTTL